MMTMLRQGKRSHLNRSLRTGKRKNSSTRRKAKSRGRTENVNFQQSSSSFCERKCVFGCITRTWGGHFGLEEATRKRPRAGEYFLRVAGFFGAAREQLSFPSWTGGVPPPGGGVVVREAATTPAAHAATPPRRGGDAWCHAAADAVRKAATMPASDCASRSRFRAASAIVDTAAAFCSL